jgi:hypothetical protein
MDTQPRTTPSEWTDNGGDPTQILSEIGYPILIEDKSHKTHVKTTQIHPMMQYLKNQITKNRRPNEHDRPDLLDHITPNQNQASQNRTKGPKEKRPQLVLNNITRRDDPLEISEQSNEQ